MSIVDTISAKLSEADRTRRDEANRLVREALTGHDTTDYDELARVVSATGADWRPIAEMLDRVAKLRPLAATAEDKQKAVVAASRAFREHQELMRDTTRELNAELAKLRAEFFRSQAVADRALAAVRDIQQLQHSNPELFGIEQVDLDRYTLISRGSVINVCDPTASMYEVSPEIFTAENDRRLKLLAAARQRAQDKYDADLKLWEKRADRLGFVPWLLHTLSRDQQDAVGPMPELSEPTWRDVLGTLGKLKKKPLAKKRGNAQRVN